MAKAKKVGGKGAGSRLTEAQKKAKAQAVDGFIDGAATANEDTPKEKDKGGRPIKPEKEKAKILTIRFTPKLLEELDNHLDSIGRHNRSAYIIEAVLQKMQKEKQQQS